MKRLLSFVSVLVFATAAVAGQGGNISGGPGKPGRGMRGHGMRVSMAKNLFPPALVLANQVALDLSEQQVATIKGRISETQGRVLDAQVRLKRVTEELQAALEPPKVDEARVLELASQAMELERRVKSAQLSLMIHVKNVLTPEQQDKARALRSERREEFEDAASD